MITFLIRYRRNDDKNWILVRAPSKSKASTYALELLRIPQTDLIAVTPLPLDSEEDE